MGNLNSNTRKERLNLPVSYERRNDDSTETDDKLKEIMKISGILTINGREYRTDVTDMEDIGELGSGTCGQVVKMRHRPSGAIIAVKVSSYIICLTIKFINTCECIYRK